WQIRARPAGRDHATGGGVHRPGRSSGSGRRADRQRRAQEEKEDRRQDRRRRKARQRCSGRKAQKDGSRKASQGCKTRKTAETESHLVDAMSEPAPRAERKTPPTPIPFTVLTGFLGAGKTTLHIWLLKDPTLAETAVVINEFGEIGLDHLLVEYVSDNMVLL